MNPASETGTPVPSGEAPTPGVGRPAGQAGQTVDPPADQTLAPTPDPPTQPTQSTQSTPHPRRRPLRTALIALTVLAVAAAGGVAASGALGGTPDDGAADAAKGPAKTAAVERTTLTRTETVDGTLGYGDPTTVQPPAGRGGAAGTLTWLPAEGAVIKRGRPVYAVNDVGIPLLYGSIPLYRTLRAGSEGDDVHLLEENLAALGYTGFTVDDTYTSGTAAAVRDWQDDLGREETGRVAPSDAVVASGARRVAEVKAVRGGALSGPVLTWTGTSRIVSVDLDTQYEDLVKEGGKATVELPDGAEAAAEVTDVGNAATAAPAKDGGSSDTEDATLPVELAVKDQKKLGRFQAAPVDVTLTAETRKNVLAVPVAALVARQGGGYAVQAVDADGTASYRPVELGIFAGGLVEVSGDGITEGLRVGVPR